MISKLTPRLVMISKSSIEDFPVPHPNPYRNHNLQIMGAGNRLVKQIVNASISGRRFMADPLHVAVYARNERELIRSIGWSAATPRMTLEAPL